MFFQREAKVNYFECDCNNRMKLSAAMQYMQQTSSEHLEALELAPDKLFRENMVFLLSKMCIRIHRMPECSQKLLVGTAAIATRGVRWVREFVIHTTDGERLVSALSLWILADPATHRVLRPSQFPYPLPFQDSITGGQVEDLPIPKAGEGMVGERIEIPVRYSHIDLNRHVNNCRYGDFVCDALPHEQLTQQGIHTVAISFQKEAKWGETLEITTQAMDEDTFCHIGE